MGVSSFIEDVPSVFVEVSMLECGLSPGGLSDNCGKSVTLSGSE